MQSTTYRRLGVFQELVRRSVFYERSRVHDDDTIEVDNSSESVSDGDDGRAVELLSDRLV